MHQGPEVAGDRLAEPAAAIDLTIRRPGDAVIAECLARQSAYRDRNALQRFLGISPWGAEAVSWFQGAIGERRAAAELARLGPEWTVLHAVPVGDAGSDIDHVVIGPGGVYTVNAKLHQQKKIWVGDKVLMVNGQRTNHLRNARHEAERASKLLSARLPVQVRVTPVIAIAGADRLTVASRQADVAVRRLEGIAGWLRRRPRVLDAAQVAAVYAVAIRPQTWSRLPLQPIAPGDRARFDALAREADLARWVRLGWGLAGLAALLLIGFSLLPG